MPASDDSDRYKEHLQEQIKAKEWEDALSPEYIKRWVAEHRTLLEEVAASINPENAPWAVEAMEKEVLAAKGATKFDGPFDQLIFSKTLEEIQCAAVELGLQPLREVQLGSSTSAGPSPYALPTDGKHMLLVGSGTSHFCNCWSKAITRALFCIKDLGPLPMPISKDEIIRAGVEGTKVAQLAARLAVYYGTYETTMGFDRITLGPEQAGHHSKLLDAMELFVIGHEYAHFIAHERFPWARQMLAPEQSQLLEFFCDELGFALSRKAGAIRNNIFAFSGTGAIAFFRASQLGSLAVQAAANPAESTSGSFGAGFENSHPFLEERIARIKVLARERTVPEQVEVVVAGIEFYDSLILSVNSIVEPMLPRVLAGAWKFIKDKG